MLSHSFYRSRIKGLKINSLGQLALWGVRGTHAQRAARSGSAAGGAAHPALSCCHGKAIVSGAVLRGGLSPPTPRLSHRQLLLSHGRVLQSEAIVPGQKGRGCWWHLVICGEPMMEVCHWTRRAPQSSLSPARSPARQSAGTSTVLTPNKVSGPSTGDSGGREEPP